MDLLTGADELAGADFYVLVSADGQVIAGLDFAFTVGVGGAVFFGLELAVAVGLGGVVTLITDADFMVVLDISSQSHWAWRSAGYDSQAENRR